MPEEVIEVDFASAGLVASRHIRNLQMSVENNRLMQRMTMLSSLERGFIDQKRGQAAADHAKILDKTLSLMSSKQMEAFKVDKEPETVKSAEPGSAAVPSRRNQDGP